MGNNLRRGAIGRVRYAFSAADQPRRLQKYITRRLILLKDALYFICIHFPLVAKIGSNLASLVDCK